MFTRYKGIEIPQNYSGSRFKSEAPITETKTHKPSPSFATRTSISPSFERIIAPQDVNEELEIDVDLTNDTNTDIEYEDTISNSSLRFEDVEEKCESDKKSLLDEFKPLIFKTIKNVNHEDLLLLSLVILLMSEGSENSSELIIPLLFLFLYR